MRKKRAPRPYWVKFLRNLAAAFLLLVIVWNVLDISLPATAEFRRLERQSLAPPSEIAAAVPTGDPFAPKVLIGLGQGWAVAGAPNLLSSTLSDLNIYPLSDGPALIPLPQTVARPDNAGHPQFHAAYAAFRPPPDAARAVLTLHNEDGDFMVEGVREGAVFLFYAHPAPDGAGRVSIGRSWFQPELFTYELAFFDENGAAIPYRKGAVS